MAYPTAAGIRYLGSDTMRMIPVMYSPEILVKFWSRAVSPAISNQSYIGQIKRQGDRVWVPGMPSFTVSDHRMGQNLDYEIPESTASYFDIDKGKSWSWSDLLLEEELTHVKNFKSQWTTACANDLQVAVDQDVLGTIPSQAHSSNYGNAAGAVSANIALGADGGTSVSVTEANAVTKMEECFQTLSEQNCPEDGEYWFAAPAWYITRLKISDVKNAALMGDGKSVLRTNRVGSLAGFTIYQSNNLTTTTDGAGATAWKILFGHKTALTFASRLTFNETVTNPFTFGSLNRGLMVYGYKTLKTEALGYLYAKPA